MPVGPSSAHETAPRVAVVGARRARQGLGPFVSRELVASGAELCAVLGTTQATAGAAAQALSTELRRDVPAYTELAALLDEARPDALAILTPHATHEAFLDAALGAGLHVLCEKPLIYGGEGLAARARRWVDQFASRRLLLRECCQWPYVLPAYDALFGLRRTSPPQQLAMRLSPDQGGAAMLVDSLSHPLSVLQALAPGEAEVEGIEHAFLPGSGDSGDRSTTRLAYVTPEARICATIELGQCRTQPRPAGLALDGRFAAREVRMPGYAIYLTDGERAVQVRDPLAALVETFVADLRAALGTHPAPSPASPGPGRTPGPVAPGHVDRDAAAPPRAGEIATRMRLFERVLDAVATAAHTSPAG